MAKPRLQSLLIDDEAFQPEHAVYHGVRHNMWNTHEVMLHTACIGLAWRLISMATRFKRLELEHETTTAPSPILSEYPESIEPKQRFALRVAA